MADRAALPQESETVTTMMEGPNTPDDDEAYGREPDDPRAAGTYDDVYDVPDYDDALEQRECCGEGVHR